MARDTVNYSKLTSQSSKYKSQQGSAASQIMAREAGKAIIPYEIKDLVMITRSRKIKLVKRVNLQGPYYFLEDFDDDQFFTHGQLELVRKHK